MVQLREWESYLTTLAGANLGQWHFARVLPWLRSTRHCRLVDVVLCSSEGAQQWLLPRVDKLEALATNEPPKVVVVSVRLVRMSYLIKSQMSSANGKPTFFSKKRWRPRT